MKICEQQNLCVANNVICEDDDTVCNPFTGKCEYTSGINDIYYTNPNNWNNVTINFENVNTKVWSNMEMTKCENNCEEKYRGYYYARINFPNIRVYFTNGNVMIVI